ncbi:MAG TPA: tape measure protein [Corynebacteriales bacterium]|nr:tape measure protein [Mycobacteriales bacterium]
MARNEWFAVLPSFKGMFTKLEEEAKRAGVSSEKILISSFDKAGQAAGKSVSDKAVPAFNEVVKATDRLAGARTRASKTTADLKAAEAALQAVQGDESKTASQRLQAEARFNKARRNNELATSQLTRAERELDVVKSGGDVKSRRLVSAEDSLARARNRVSDTNDRVGVKEKQLEEARKKGDPVKVAKAEGNLTKARADAHNAADKLTLREQQLAAAKDKEAEAADRAASANNRLGGSARSGGGALGWLKGKAEESHLSLGRLAISGIKAGGALAGIGSIVGMVKAGWGRLTQIEDATVSMKTIMGNAVEARALVDDISKAVQGTPFQLQDFVTAGKNLKAFGIEAKVIPNYLRAIGEAAAAGGKGTEGFNSMARAMGKIAAKNKVSLEDLNTMMENGVPAIKILANHFNVAEATMTKMISKGSVPATEAMNALAKGIMEGSDGVAGHVNALKGSMEGLRTETVTGALGGLASAVTRFSAEALRPMVPHVTAFADKLTTLTDNIAKGAAPAFQLAGRVAGGMFKAIGAGFDVLVSIPKFFDSVSSSVSRAVDWFKRHEDVVDALKGVAISTTAIVSPLLIALGAKALLAAKQAVVAAAKSTAAWLTTKRQAVVSAAATVKALYMQGVAWMKNGARALASSKLFRAAWTAATGPVGIAIAAITAVGGALMLLWKKSDTFRNGMLFAWETLKVAWSGVSQAFSAAGHIISQTWKSVGGWFANVWQNHISPVIDMFSAGWETTKQFFSDAMGAISGAWQSLGDLFKRVYESTVRPVGDALEGMASKIKTAFMGVGDGIKGAFLGAIEALKAPIHLLGNLLARIPTKIGGITVPGAGTLHEWAVSLQNFKHGGVVSGRDRDGLLYGGVAGQDSIIGLDEAGVPTALVMPGERVMTVEEQRRAGHVLDAIHDGWDPARSSLPRYADGGVVGGKRTNDDLMRFLRGMAPDVSNNQSLQGTPYRYGGGAPWGDCSYTVGAVAGYMAGLAEPNSRRLLSTGNAGSVLSDLGWTMGKGASGTLRVGWYGVGMTGHTAGTLPDGTNFEMRSGDGGLIGDGASGYNLAGATNWAWIKPAAEPVDPNVHQVDYGIEPEVEEPAAESEEKTHQQSVAEMTGLKESNTWSELGFNVATELARPAVTGFTSDFLEHFGFSDQLPSWMVAGKMAADELKPGEDAEGETSESAATTKAKEPKEPTKNDKLEAIAGHTGDYDPAQGASQWTRLFAEVLDIQQISPTRDIVDSMVRRADVLSRGNPNLVRKRPPKPSKDPEKPAKPYPAGQDQLIGMFSLTASMARGIPKQLGTVYDAAGNAYAAARYAQNKWGSVKTGMDDNRFPFVKDEDIPRYAHGGWVRGKKGKDKNLAYLTDGEYVVNANASKAAATTLDRINQSPSDAQAVERQVRGAAMHAPADIYDAFVPQAAENLARTTVSTMAKGASTAVSTAGNAASRLVSAVPVVGDIGGAGIGMMSDLASAGIELVSEPVADVAGMAANYVAAAPSRAWHAGADTLNEGLPTLSGSLNLPGVSPEFSHAVSQFVPQINIAGGGGGGGATASGGSTIVTNNFYGSTNEMRHQFRHEEQRKLAGVGMYRGQM